MHTQKQGGTTVAEEHTQHDCAVKDIEGVVCLRCFRHYNSMVESHKAFLEWARASQQEINRMLWEDAYGPDQPS